MSNLYSVCQIFDAQNGYLKGVEKSEFHIPEYQRGYKWSGDEVKKLLKDIETFIDKNKVDGDKFYCLQNITLIPNMNGASLNVVDGQQRLTALVILLSRLGLEILVRNKIEYAVRKSTHDFLTTFITKETVAEEEIDFNSEWKVFAQSHKQYDHQDIYYIFSTVKTIDEWLSGKDDNFKNDFRNGLLHQVKLIVNKVDSNNEEKVFGNLNSNRIPLDGADLVRAILITRVANEESEKVGDIKNIVRVNERRVRIGWEMDEINTWWSKDEIKGYFKAFIKNKSEGDIIFNADNYPINNLFLLFSEKKKKASLTLDLIEEQESALELYKELIKLHHTLQDWYVDREIYHYMGFLFGQTKITFNTIFEKWNKSQNRTSFKNDLKNEIFISIFSRSSIIKAFRTIENWYKDSKLVKVLLVLDIISSLPEERVKLPYLAFTKNNNDIEHIFPQNPEEITEKKEYIEFLNKYVLKDKQSFDLSDYEVRKDEVEYQNKMGAFIDAAILDIGINSIGNLVLLYYSLNRSLGRIPYTQKRGRVIKFFNEGHFIQPHTFQVFARYFTNDKSESYDLEHWTNIDIEENAKAIRNRIIAFFKPKKKW
ncbi:MAG: DUF262 domain-containing protein [Bacteroidetes bacterium]|nr:DUF262 domain-containing protein [Bacteroidota bacterium]